MCECECGVGAGVCGCVTGVQMYKIFSLNKRTEIEYITGKVTGIFHPIRDLFENQVLIQSPDSPHLVDRLHENLLIPHVKRLIQTNLYQAV